MAPVRVSVLLLGRKLDPAGLTPPTLVYLILFHASVLKSRAIWEHGADKGQDSHTSKRRGWQAGRTSGDEGTRGTLT